MVSFDFIPAVQYMMYFIYIFYLSLNVKKSNYVIFKPKAKRRRIEINGHKIAALRKLLFLVLFWMKTFHGNHISNILLANFLNLLVLLVDQILVSLSLPGKLCVIR